MEQEGNTLIIEAGGSHSRLRRAGRWAVDHTFGLNPTYRQLGWFMDNLADVPMPSADQTPEAPTNPEA